MSQYQLLFNDDVFPKIREQYRLQDIVRLEKQVEHLQHVVNGYKGAEAKRKKCQKNIDKKQNEEPT